MDQHEWACVKGSIDWLMERRRSAQTAAYGDLGPENPARTSTAYEKHAGSLTSPKGWTAALLKFNYDGPAPVLSRCGMPCWRRRVCAYCNHRVDETARSLIAVSPQSKIT